MISKVILIGATLFIIIGICLGALGAHSIQPLISSSELDSFRTGVDYQLYHGLSILVLALLTDRLNIKFLWPIRLMFAGVILFSGSIYLLSLKTILGIGSWVSVLGPITPIGGLILISSWISLLVISFKLRK
jgi:uncharacterized membrane protein YgdD (TMEM256/DUF423 family)